MIGRINLALARIIRRILGKRLGKVVHFVLWFFIFDTFVRPVVLKLNLVLDKIINIPSEKALYLQNISKANPLSLEFWFDPCVLPVVIVVILAYLLTLIIPFIFSFQARKVFRKE